MCLYSKFLKLDEKQENYRGVLYAPLISARCNKCEECLNLYNSNWKFRIDEELKLSEKFKFNNNHYFLTLTYNNLNLPKINDTPTLCYSDVQKFFKRVRRYLDYHNIGAPKPLKLKYIVCGEYGKRYTKRPHYHVLLLNAGKLTKKDLLKLWNKGNIHIGKNVTSESIGYLTKYMIKGKLEKSNTISVYKDKRDGSFIHVDVNKKRQMRKKGEFLYYIKEREYYKEDINNKKKNSNIEFFKLSKGIGLSFLDSVTDKDKEKIINLSYFKVIKTKTNKIEKLFCPTYFIRKLFLEEKNKETSREVSFVTCSKTDKVFKKYRYKTKVQIYGFYENETIEYTKYLENVYKLSKIKFLKNSHFQNINNNYLREELDLKRKEAKLKHMEYLNKVESVEPCF